LALGQVAAAAVGVLLKAVPVGRECFTIFQKMRVFLDEIVLSFTLGKALAVRRSHHASNVVVRVVNIFFHGNTKNGHVRVEGG
jgi:hypothetical protein